MKAMRLVAKDKRNSTQVLYFEMQPATVFTHIPLVFLIYAVHPGNKMYLERSIYKILLQRRLKHV